LLLLFDLSDIPMQGKDYWHTSKKKDKNTEEDESPDWDYIIVTKGGPRTHCSKPKEN